MPDQDIKLGTAADEPKAQDANAPDMNRYYYPPGKTEPELKPEFANEAAASTTETTDEEVEQPTLKGKLPEDFPGHGALEEAGITSYAGVRKSLDSLEDVDGIGPATAERIREAMGESPEEQEDSNK